MMHRFWDYRAKSVEQVREAVRELSKDFGDPFRHMSGFCDAVGIAQHFISADVYHIKGVDVRLSYTVPDRMFRIEIEAEKPREVYRRQFARVLRKHMAELKRAKKPSVEPVLIFVESDRKENPHDVLYIR